MHIFDSIKWFFIEKAVAGESLPNLQGLNPGNRQINPPTSADPFDAVRAALSRAGDNMMVVLLLAAGILAVLYTVWHGILYITSGGNAEKAKIARNGVINGVIGVIIVIASFAFIRLAIQFGNFLANSFK